MHHDHSPEEVRQQRERVMGPVLGAEYHALWTDLVWLTMKWDELKRLYCTEERINLLNQTAPRFFAELQGTTFRDVLLQIARITDSPQSMGHDNLIPMPRRAAVKPGGIHSVVRRYVAELHPPLGCERSGGRGRDRPRRPARSAMRCTKGRTRTSPSLSAVPRPEGLTPWFIL